MTLPPLELQDVILAAVVTLSIFVINTTFTTIDFRQRYQYKIFVNDIYKATLYSNHLYDGEKLAKRIAIEFANTPEYDKEPEVSISIRDRRRKRISSR